MQELVQSGISGFLEQRLAPRDAELMTEQQLAVLLVGVEHEPANAVVELSCNAKVLVRQNPGRFDFVVRHGVVRHRVRNLVEPAVAEFFVSVALGIGL